jgi:hypothetical protein
MKTKTGIEIPDENDRYYGADEALHTLWKVCRQICDVLDKQQDEIDLLGKQEPAIKSSVKQDDVAGIMNAINGALLDNGLHYVATGYDNTGPWLSVMIEKE